MLEGGQAKHTSVGHGGQMHRCTQMDRRVARGNLGKVHYVSCGGRGRKCWGGQASGRVGSWGGPCQKSADGSEGVNAQMHSIHVKGGQGGKTARKLLAGGLHANRRQH